jgi:hypothetical protein
MNTLLRSTLDASKLLSALLLAWTGCNSPSVEPPPTGEPTGCEETGTCGSLGASSCTRVHVWDVWQFGTDQDDQGVAVGTDEECNIYVAGNTRGRFSGAGNLNVTEAGAGLDIFSARFPPIMPDVGYPGAASFFPDIRVTQLGSAGEDSVKDIAIGSDRTTFLVGATAGRMPGASGPGQGFNDVFATKLRSTGVRDWTQQYGSPEEDAALGVVLRQEGNGLNAYLAGASQADVSEGFQITLDKLGPDGSIAARKTYGTYNHDRAEGLALDPSGNIFIVGSTMGDYKEPGSHVGSTDVFVTKIAQQNLDAEEWKSQVATSDIDAALDAVVDNEGHLYVLAVSFSDLEQGVSENDGLQNSFLLKYNVWGDRPEWIKRIGVQSKYSRATGMALDSQGRVYVAGFTMGTMEDGKPNAGGRDAFVARYDAQGETDWARQIGTAGNEEASDVVVTPGGDVVITGFTTGDLWGFGNQGRQDAFIARFSLTSQQ